MIQAGSRVPADVQIGVRHARFCMSQVLQRDVDHCQHPERQAGQLERHTIGQQGWAPVAVWSSIRLRGVE